jgi:hypothetical protein
MTSKLKENIINPTKNIKLQKAEEITGHSDSRKENIAKISASLKKIYLPTIQKKTMPTIQDSPITRRIKKSQSQAILLNDYNSPLSANTEKEKILLAKSSLLRINAQIHDLTLNYRRLQIEKEDNLNIIKKALCSDDPTYTDTILLKIEQFLEETLKNFNHNNKSISTINYENMRITDDKNSKLDDSKEKNNKSMAKDENDNISNNEKNSNNNEENIENNNISQENQHKHNNSIETRAEDPNKVNSFNNSRVLNNNSINVNANNSLEEQIKCIKETIEEKDEDKGAKIEKTLQIESGIFEKSSVPTRVFNILKAKSELSFLKHRLINIQQKIKLKNNEIEELKSKAKMKNILFQKNVLDSQMITLQQAQSKKKEIEEISLPSKNLMMENLRKNLKYYNEINKSYLVGNKDIEENYFKKKNEFDEKSKNYTNLEAKNNNLKFKYNSLRLNDLKKNINLQNMKAKINLIDEIREIIESLKSTIKDKKEEIEYGKNILNERIDKYNKTREKKENTYQEMNQLQREFNSQISKRKNEANKVKREGKEIDVLINKEIQIFDNLNKKDKNVIGELLLNKGKNNSEFLKFLSEFEIYENNKFAELKKNRFKKLKKGNKIEYDIISTVKKEEKKVEKKQIETKSSADVKLLEEKLVYYLNSKGEKESSYNEFKDVEKSNKNEESKEKEKTIEKGKK